MGNDPSPLPEFEDLKCELYPKNASQMWNEFTRDPPPDPRAGPNSV